MPSALVSMLAFIAVLALLIGFHEMAHLVVAKLFGVKVIRFSLGFGPSIAKRKIGETEYVLSLFPLGGYVQPLSEEVGPEHQEPNHPEKYFEFKPAWQRFLIYVVGPTTNLWLAFLLVVGLFYFVGLPVPTTTLDSVLKDSPAEQAGLKSGDKIVAVNGEAVSSWAEITKKIQTGKGAPVNLKVEREKELLSIAVTPELKDTPQGKQWTLGIAPKSVYEPQGIVNSTKSGFISTVYILKIFVDFFHKLFSGKVAAKDSFGGPITIYTEVGKAGEQGSCYLFFFSFFFFFFLFFFFLFFFSCPPVLGGENFFRSFF